MRVDYISFIVGTIFQRLVSDLIHFKPFCAPLPTYFGATNGYFYTARQPVVLHTDAIAPRE